MSVVITACFSACEWQKINIALACSVCRNYVLDLCFRCVNVRLVSVFMLRIISPALLQSTVKLFFCPTKAFDSPVPRQTTLLASDVSFVEVVEAL